MPKQDLPLSQNPFSAPWSSLGLERLENFYLELAQSATSKAKYYAVNRQGLVNQIPQTSMDATRCWITTSGERTFQVAGRSVYELTNLGKSRILIGTLATATGIVVAAENGYDLLFVDGSYGYHYSLTASYWYGQIGDQYFPGVTDTGFDTSKGPTHVYCIDTIFVVNSKDTTDAFWSAPGYKPYAFDPLQPSVTNLWWGTQFISKIGDTDHIVSMCSAVNHLYVAGINSTEVFWHTDDKYGQIFQRIDGAIIGVGCSARYSMARAGSNVYLLGTESRTGALGMFVIHPDFTVERISKLGVETRIAAYPRIDDCFSFVFSMGRHTFIAWQFPSGSSVDGGPVTGATWIYDLTTGQWTRWTKFNEGFHYRWQAQLSTFSAAWNKTLVGDGAGDAVYALDSEAQMDDKADASGTYLLGCELTTPIGYLDNKVICYLDCQLNMQQGVGLRNNVNAGIDQMSGTTGTDPTVSMQYSNDLGTNWSEAVDKPMGSIGNAMVRTRWTLCGRARNRIWWFKLYAPVRRVVTGLTNTVQILSN